jgi:hypothetical protein
MDITVAFKCPSRAIEIARMLNEIARYLEGNEPPPNHWEEAKREKFYFDITQELTKTAKTMAKKL